MLTNDLETLEQLTLKREGDFYGENCQPSRKKTDYQSINAKSFIIYLGNLDETSMKVLFNVKIETLVLDEQCFCSQFLLILWLLLGRLLASSR